MRGMDVLWVMSTSLGGNMAYMKFNNVIKLFVNKRVASRDNNEFNNLY